LAISKGCGKEGKRLLVFIPFHQTGISTAFRRAKNHTSSDYRCASWQVDGAQTQLSQLSIKPFSGKSEADYPDV
jgi:hypothetical protein